MQVEALKELDRIRNMSLQALAMSRIRDSVMTMSRETGFRERPVESFSQAPLYIPQYQQWSNTLNKIVGTPPPTMPQELQGYDMNTRSPWEYHGQWFKMQPYQRQGRTELRQIPISKAEGIKWSGLIQGWKSEYASWEQAQRNLPA